MIEAARLLDPLFMRQVSSTSASTLLLLLDDASPLGQSRLRYFLINKGPWSALDEDQPFIPAVGPKPKGGNFYPAMRLAKKSRRGWSPCPRRSANRRRDFSLRFGACHQARSRAVPYSVEYQGELIEAARLLRESAAATTQPTLKNFLEKRARAFLTNDYYDSDIAWMELDASIEPTIGPTRSMKMSGSTSRQRSRPSSC